MMGFSSTLYLPGTIQLCIYLFTIYFLLSVNITNGYRQQMNDYLLLILSIVSVLSLKNTHHDHIYVVAIAMFILLSILFYFLQKVKNDRFALHTPLGYLSFYFSILVLVLLSGSSLSLLFPEIFLLAVLFATTNAGRKISFGVALMGATTIGLLYLHNPVASGMLYRVCVTISFMIAIPQVVGLIYKKKIELVRAERMNVGEGL
jgi:hypothetical protein